MDTPNRRHNFEKILANIPLGDLDQSEMLATFDEDSRFVAVEYDDRSESAWAGAHPTIEAALASFGGEGSYSPWYVIDLESGTTWDVQISPSLQENNLLFGAPVT